MRSLFKLAILFSVPISLIISIFLGRYPVNPGEAVRAILSIATPHLVHSPPETVKTIVVLYRLPRVLAAAITGAALAVTGASLQSILRNPLVDTYILGISAGAGFGAALAIAFLPPVPIEFVAFLGALMAFFITFSIAMLWGKGSVIAIVLSGVIVNALFQAGLSLVKYLCPDPYKLATVTFWLMGSIGAAAFWNKVLRMGIVVTLCAVLLYSIRWRLDILSLGDEEAVALGASPIKERAMVVAVCAMAVATIVCYTGIIGWVGLLIPHIVRLTVGADNRDVLPYSMLLGASFMVVADDLARCLTSTEIPIGILTTVMVAPFYVYLLKRSAGVWR
ncbi:MAG: iron ABC transporter permease [Candidatus Altiarchaeales archaeon]|nr:MAG: iron ABC transporter permease [Candidatus Altiarchaeales archaeon]